MLCPLGFAVNGSSQEQTGFGVADPCLPRRWCALQCFEVGSATGDNLVIPERGCDTTDPFTIAK